MKSSFLLAAMFLTYFATHAGTIIVMNTNDAGAGSLRQAVIDASAGDTIRFNPTLLSTVSDTIFLNENIDFSKSLVFKGLYSSTDTLFISGQNQYGIFDFDAPFSGPKYLILDSMSLIHGNNPSHGGAVQFNGEYLEIRNSYICYNHSNLSGGGVYSNAYFTSGYSTNEVLVVNSKINYNSANTSMGGGLVSFATDDSKITMFNSELIGNSIPNGSGGGLHSLSIATFSQVKLTDCTVMNNDAGGDGGGVYARSVSNSSAPGVIDSMQMILQNCQITNNISGAGGGGIYAYLDSEFDNSSLIVTVDNSTVDSNTCTNDGGGIFIFSDNFSYDLLSTAFTVSNATISNNIAGEDGGGIYVNTPYTVNSGSNLTVENAIIENNSAGMHGGGIYCFGYFGQLNVRQSSVVNNEANGNGGGIFFRTRFASLLFNNAVLLSKSTIAGNSATSGGGLYLNHEQEDYESLNANYSTIYNNDASAGGAVFATSFSSSAPYSLRFLSSIIVDNGTNAIDALNLESLGYNIFNDAVVSGSVATDQLGIDSTTLNLGPLQNNGGFTPTHMPNIPSPAIDLGDPSELSPAQNWVLNGTRESGSTERATIINESLTIAVCDSFIAPSGNQVWYTSGNYTDTIFATPNDTLYSIDLTILNTSSTIIENICSGSYTTPQGTVYTSTGIYFDTLINSNSCDSIITYDLTFNTPTFATIEINECTSYISPSGMLLTTSGIYQDTILNISGCDSIVTIDLNINQSFASITEFTCNSNYTAPSGAVYTTSGIYFDTIPNSLSCDSIITIDLTMGSPSASTDLVTACDSFTWIDGNTYFTSNNTATFVTTNASGCDSTITLDLTLNFSETATDVITACDSYTWIDGNTYTASNNSAQVTLNTTSGCDSVVTLNLTINNSTSGTDIVTACDSFTWIDGITYTNSNSTATYTIPNATGCDSVISLDLTINSITANVTNNSPMLIAAPGANSYQWVDCLNGFAPISGATNNEFTATSNGEYAVIIESNGCSDTSVCYVVDNVSIEEYEIVQWNVYPNPTDGVITIQLNSLPQNGTIEIINPLGQTITTKEVSSLKNEFLLNEESGIYFIRLTCDKKSEMVPIVLIN